MAPHLSIIVAAQQASDTIVACINSLLAQAPTGELQIIIAVGAYDSVAELIEQQFPELQLVISPLGSLPRLLGAGMKEAYADLIAITEAHCIFPPGWFNAVIAAHQQNPGPVIGGAVEPGPGLRWSDWALYFADYGQFMQPLAPGPSREMPGENVSFKRTILKEAQDAGCDFVQNGFWKTFFCDRLQQAGHSLIAAPQIVISYNRQLGFRHIVNRRLAHGRCYGGMRASRISAQRRAWFAFAGWLLPALLTIRLWRKVWPKRRYRREFILSFPLSLMAILAWSAGEWWGNLFGSGNACDYI